MIIGTGDGLNNSGGGVGSSLIEDLPGARERLVC